MSEELLLNKINTTDKYIMPGSDEVRFAIPGQTLSLILGSCISTVFIGRNDRYIAAANHIMIAKQRNTGVIVRRSALEQIDDIMDTYYNYFDIAQNNLRCLHLVGAGRKILNDSFHVHEENIAETKRVLSGKSVDILFEDIWSHYFATYSLGDDRLSVFIEDKLVGIHISYIIDLDRLFEIDPKQGIDLPASALKPNNRGFEEFVDRGVIVFITGEKNRRYE